MDTVMTLLERAWQAGLRACAEGDKLVVRGPKHAAELAEQLLEHKTEVLALLQQPPVCRQSGRPQHEADVICPDPAPIDEHYPVAPGHVGTEPTEWDSALADAWIQITLERVSGWHDDLAPDCPVDGADWDKAEALVDAAYIAQSRQVLRDALDNYEQHVQRCFIAWCAQHEDAA